MEIILIKDYHQWTYTNTVCISVWDYNGAMSFVPYTSYLAIFRAKELSSLLACGYEFSPRVQAVVFDVTNTN